MQCHCKRTGASIEYKWHGTDSCSNISANTIKGTPVWTHQYQIQPPNPWQQLLEAATAWILDCTRDDRKHASVDEAIAHDKDSYIPESIALFDAVKALEGASVPTMPEPPMTLHQAYARAIAAARMDRTTQHVAGPSESQKRLGLRSTRYVNASPWDSDID